MSRLPILLACIGLYNWAPDDNRPFNATEEASRAAEAAAQSVEEGVTAAEAPATNAWTKGAMVAAADPRAVEAGLEMLRQGGSAIDAAIAVHSVLGLVEPQSSGIGGGAFMVYYDRAKDEITVFDGREVAPASTTPDHFMKDGKPLGFLEAWQSGKAVGVPGQIALYKTSHEAAGKLEWDVFQPLLQAVLETDFAPEVLQGFFDPLTLPETASISQFQSLCLAGRGPRRHHGRARTTVGEGAVGFERGKTTTIEHHPAPDLPDCGHLVLSLFPEQLPLSIGSLTMTPELSSDCPVNGQPVSTDREDACQR